MIDSISAFRAISIGVAGASIALALGAGGGGAARPPVSFGRDVRPLLADRCFKCHGADAAAREADLRLDVREQATAERKDKSGAKTVAITPGNAETSELWRRVTSEDDSEQMPPVKSHKARLSPAELETVKRWIDEGAPYEPHWAFTPPARPAVPDVKHAAWARTPVDRFIAARLEQEGLEPSAEATRPEQFRRLFLDLTGLPPTPEELDAYIADTRPDAYESWVDRIFTQEPYRSRFAERMTAPWLDQARYADTCGIHMDAGRQIWPWRDWVLRAYRENKPFDVFLTEQIAGDLLPAATLDQKVASGFNRNHVTTDEGGAIAEEYLVEYAVDRVATTGSVFLGLTLGCARCHDHKYDPVTQEDFYKLFAYFDSIEEPGLYSQEPNPNRAFEPFLRVPSPEQEAQQEKIAAALAAAKGDLDKPVPEEEEQRTAFLSNLTRDAGLAWTPAVVAHAEAAGGAAMTVQPDGSVLASGNNPAKDTHKFTVRVPARAGGYRALCVEALPDASMPGGRVGRAFNGNAVLSRLTADAGAGKPVHFTWAWANHEQADGDFRAVNVLDGGGDRGWALQGHEIPGGRVLMLLSDRPFADGGETELHLQLDYQGIWDAHTIGRVRFSVSPMLEPALARLPVAQSHWAHVGPFPAADAAEAFAKEFGPEQSASIDRAKNFGFGNQYWRTQPGFADGAVHELAAGVNVHYVARRVFAPTARQLTLSLGSDDGVRAYVNGKEVFKREINRPAAPDQEKINIDLAAGENTVLLRIANTGGPAGFYYRPIAPDAELAGDLVASTAPEAARTADMKEKLASAWKLRYSPSYRKKMEAVAEQQRAAEKLESEIPLTMVMKELPKPRETFVLKRGQYAAPDKNHPVSRGIPAALGALPKGAPADRLGLAQWMTSPENPLTARVAVNRLWEFVFGAGIVRTSEDFGLQGEWPSHRELLDWLAVEFREGGWNVEAMLKMLVTSATYRQSSRTRPEAAERDPENRLLSYFPRRRLAAEQIRDLALYTSGLLVEKFGGPSVKPYQPAGLWEEVAMVQSNTRMFKRDDGAGLYRRSIYTYWKRASPPPSMLMMDAPTREFCTIRRSSTNTPLQALVLWNDEQLVEAARVLAARTIAETGEQVDDAIRIGRLARRVLGRDLAADDRKDLEAALASFRERYKKSPDDAAKLLAVGASPLPAGADKSELAAWTVLANALLSCDGAVTRS